jgi:hypothetical protein
MKISELIEKLELVKALHGDIIVIAEDDEYKHEIEDAYLGKFNQFISDGKGGYYDKQLAVILLIEN